jgi:hypothetical protein
MSQEDQPAIKGSHSVFVNNERLVSGPAAKSHNARDISEDHGPLGAISRDFRPNYHWELRRLRATARRNDKL